MSTDPWAVPIDPATGEQDGPYLLMGTEEYTMEEVGALIDALRELSGFSRDTTIPRQPDKAASERK